MSIHRKFLISFRYYISRSFIYHCQYPCACQSLSRSYSSCLNSSLKFFQAFDGRWKKFGQPKFVYTVDVQLTLDQCRAVRIKPAEGRVEALSDTEGITANLGGIKGYNTIVDGLYDGTYMLLQY